MFRNSGYRGSLRRILASRCPSVFSAGIPPRLGCLLIWCCVVLGTATAHADWHQASGEHFVVYADQSHKQIKRYAEKLERFHAAMAFVFASKKTSPSPSNRVTVYVVGSRGKVRKLYGGDNSRYVEGFYSARAGGSVAIVPRVFSKSKGDVTQSEQVLLHEYAHHFLHVHNTQVLPRWYVEGFAEFYSTAHFDKDGGIGLGLPARHRAWELSDARKVPLREIFDTELYLKRKTGRYDNFYGRSWLLYHYFFFVSARKPQVQDYFRHLQSGVSEPVAAQRSFGDLGKLEREIKGYMRRRKLSYIKLTDDKLPIKEVSVRALSPGEAAMMPVVMVSKLGVTQEEALALLPEAREVAEQHPGDPFVLGALAEAEVDAGNIEASIAAANAALALAPGSIQAQMQKGIALLASAKARTAEASGSKAADAWSAVRQQFIRTNQLETENPLPLVFFYRSYLEQGLKPTENSIDGLEWALQLAPFDDSVRWLVGKQQVRDERYEAALHSLAPLAFGPHRSADNVALKLYRSAQEMLAKQERDSK